MLGMVMEMNSPGLFCCRIWAAPSSFAMAEEFSISGSSRVRPAERG
jgi:hypothetical protein